MLFDPEDEADAEYLRTLGRNQRMGINPTGPLLPTNDGRYDNPTTWGALGRDVMGGVNALVQGFDPARLGRGIESVVQGVNYPEGAVAYGPYGIDGAPAFRMRDGSIREVTAGDRRHGGLLDLMDLFPMAGVQGGPRGALGAGASTRRAAGVASPEDAPTAPAVQRVTRPTDKPLPELATRYPATVAPREVFDVEKGRSFMQKQPSEEALRVQGMRQRAQRAIDRGEYEPYFPVVDRADVDPSNYRAPVDTRNANPVREDTLARHRGQYVTPEAAQRIERAFDVGRTVPNSDRWYFMRQLEQEFIRVLGPEEGRRAFQRQFADSMAATTGGASPADNLTMAQYANFMRARGLPAVEEAHALPYPVGGRFVSGNMRMANQAFDGGLPFDLRNPKRADFSSAFTGNLNAMTMDERMSGAIAPGLGAPPTGTYGTFRSIPDEIAARRGVAPRDFQDVTWAGINPGAVSKPMIQVFNEAVERTRRITGQTPEDVVRQNFILSRGPLFSMTPAGLLAIPRENDDE